MHFLNRANHAKSRCKRRKAFLLRRFCKILIHVCPLIVLPVGCGIQILSRIADQSQFLAPHLRMCALVIRRLLKNRGNLLIAFLFCDLRKKSIAVSRLRLPCKCCFQILFRLCSCILVHRILHFFTRSLAPTLCSNFWLQLIVLALPYCASMPDPSKFIYPAGNLFDGFFLFPQTRSSNISGVFPACIAMCGSGAAFSSSQTRKSIFFCVM